MIFGEPSGIRAVFFDAAYAANLYHPANDASYVSNEGRARARATSDYK